MIVNFYKYHGAGNDFIIINDYNHSLIKQFNTKIIQKMCDRHFGIGADGLMILLKAPNYNFAMRYYNADGKESTMCGNGGRCIVAFANEQLIIKNEAVFSAIDGIHKAKILPDGNISIQMKNVSDIKKLNDATIIDTGSPHFIKYVSNTNNVNVTNEGKEIRNRSEFQPDGINVNFITSTKQSIKIRTYERGVENETLACGTGSVAAAIASKLDAKNGRHSVKIETLGGILMVTFDKLNQNFNNVFLTGQAEFVFSGQYKTS